MHISEKIHPSFIRSNKIYIEPNIEPMKEIAECFKVLVEDYEKGTVFQFDNTK